MDAREALELVDRLIYSNTGKYLNDLERQVFIGSWNGKTYDEIYPANPEYVEKYVGYKLWQKLSKVCGEKVTKKQFRGALERVIQRHSSLSSHPLIPSSSHSDTPVCQQRVFISYRNQEPDLGLAKQFCEAIVMAGHHASMSNEKSNEKPFASMQGNQYWLASIDANLQECDYFLLLLSRQAAVSEMVIEELERAKRLHQRRGNASEKNLQTNKPLILPIRVNCQPDTLLNHDLRSYLQDIPQREWNSPTDTPTLVQAVLDCINGNGEWRMGE
ncbi:MAG: toll/interleukin-1 receptor domain-containing protein [Leptolyngbyaceae cyanobacterium RU_5_1]|nr:toll/interleukin-1 receptor domain-containing protein [Leptolyngbyaceae cyanobacterium RU_5_1]